MTGAANVERREGFSQVCVWEGVVVAESEVEDFLAFIRDELGARAQYLESLTTGPGKGGPGGRTDVLFSVHEDDIGTFAIRRLRAGVRWIEDVFANGGDVLYPPRVLEYATWNATDETGE